MYVVRRSPVVAPAPTPATATGPSPFWRWRARAVLVLGAGSWSWQHPVVVRVPVLRAACRSPRATRHAPRGGASGGRTALPALAPAHLATVLAVARHRLIFKCRGEGEGRAAAGRFGAGGAGGRNTTTPTASPGIKHGRAAPPRALAPPLARGGPGQ